MLRLVFIWAVAASVYSIEKGTQGRVSGGEETTIEQFPHQISLRYKEKHICGGAIIKWDAIVTAAHCVTGAQLETLTVVAGSTILTEGEPIQVKRINAHPLYNSLTTHNDIAVLILEMSFSYSETIQPILLPGSNEEIKNGTKVLVSGWGADSWYGSFSNTLKQATLTIFDNAQCQAIYDQNIIASTMLCAGEYQTGQEACYGDSGGPLIADGKLVGIVNWGSGCGGAGYPGIYARLTSFRDWIDSLPA